MGQSKWCHILLFLLTTQKDLRHYSYYSEQDRSGRVYTTSPDYKFVSFGVYFPVAHILSDFRYRVDDASRF